MIVFKSTRDSHWVHLDEAILKGLADDGGLYIPDQLPQMQWEDFKAYRSLPEFAYYLLRPFFEKSAIPFDLDFCRKIFNVPMPLHRLADRQYVLELFHGPTLSFKDFGARFFAACLSALAKNKEFKVLVATSGDTGSAVAAALFGQPGVKAVILFPYKQITARQQAQITTWGGNVKALAVNGRFDDCQRLVKAAFSDEDLAQSYHLTTANSINIARLLPQMLFYAYSSVYLAAKGQQPVHFIVPSGNLGNVTACYWAREMGFPIGEIQIATNENRALLDYWNTGDYQPHATISTLANAMDVGNPSNLERLLALYSDYGLFKREVNVEAVSDEEIRQAIVQCYQESHYLICPHTATAYHRLQVADPEKTWIIAATAAPAKFEEVIEPLLGIHLPIPKSLEKILARDEQFQRIEPQLEDVIKWGLEH